jgi:hypothetical protein
MKRRTWLIFSMFCLMVGGLQVSGFAAPRGRGGMHVGRSERGGIHEGFRGRSFGRARTPRVFVGPSFGWGWGWGSPWIWDPYYYPGSEVLEVRHVNYGTVEFKVKPEDTRIYIDKKFAGTVAELDHHKAYMAEGNHEITLKAPDNGSNRLCCGGQENQN